MSIDAIDASGTYVAELAKRLLARCGQDPDLIEQLAT